MTGQTRQKLLFLSHSGSDTEAARELRQRILDSPAARDAGLDVWLDVDGGLQPGSGWQEQLEDALRRCTAFCVYVGSRGIVNWVDREVREALDRATGVDAIPFIPVTASAEVEWTLLPPFVRQFQGVTDPLGDEAALAALISAAIAAPMGPIQLTDEPFVGLRAMEEAEADRFFGRDPEIRDLTALVRAHPLTAVVADSGAGKSSLVRAGLIPAFRGGALAPEDRAARDRIRLAVVMRPGADPIQGLKVGIDRAARMQGLDQSARRSLRRGVQPGDPGETAYALACDLPPDQTDVLLVVDQFEELLTQASVGDAQRFVDLLLALAQPSAHRSIRIVLTVRADYYNLIRRHQDLFDVLQADNGAAQLRLKQIGDEALAQIVTRPLVMAGNSNAAERDALLAAIRRDITGRPGDMALIQMALYATWREAQRDGGGLVEAYTRVHGVLGALAFEAERTQSRLLEQGENDLLLPLFVRLIKLGDTGGATRRPVALEDLGPERTALAQKLATEEAGRLLMVSDTSAEIAHEALVAQWPWLQQQAQENAADIRTLGRLGEQTAIWEAADHKSNALPNEAARKIYQAVQDSNDAWLIDRERQMLRAGQRKKLRNTLAGSAILVAMLTLFGLSVWFGIQTQKTATDLAAALQVAEKNERAAVDAQALADTRAAEAQQATAEAMQAQQLALQRLDQAERAEEAARKSAEEADEQADIAERERKRAETERNRALAERETALASEAKARNVAAGFLGSLARTALSRGDAVNAAKFALAAWPRDADSVLPKSNQVFDTLKEALPMLRKPYRERRVDWMECGPHGQHHAVVQTPEQTALIDLRTVKSVFQHRSFPSFPNLVVANDGSWYATGSYQDISRLVSDEGRRRTRLATSGRHAPSVIAKSADDRLIAVGDRLKGKVHFWDPASHREAEPFDARTRASGPIALSSDGQMIAMGRESEVLVIHLETGERRVLQGKEKGRVLTLDFFDNDRRLIGRDRTDRAVLVWDLQGAADDVQGASIGKIGLNPESKKDSLLLSPMAISANGGRIAVVRHIETVSIGAGVEPHDWSATVFRYDYYFESEIGSSLRLEYSHTRPVVAVDMDKTGERVIFGDRSGQAVLLAPDMKTVLARKQFPGKSIACVAFRPDGDSAILVAADGTPLLWTFADDSDVLVSKGLGVDLAKAQGLSGPARRLLLADTEQRLRLLDFATGQLIELPDGQAMSALDMQSGRVMLSPDGTALALAKAGQVTVWDVDGWKMRDQLTLAANATVTNMAFDRTGRKLAVGGRGPDPTARGAPVEGHLHIRDLAEQTTIFQDTVDLRPHYGTHLDWSDPGLLMFGWGGPEVGGPPAIAVTPDGNGAYRTIDAPPPWPKATLRPGWARSAQDGDLGARLDKDQIVIFDIASKAIVAQLSHDRAPAAGLFTGPRAFTAVLTDGRVARWDLSWIPKGNLFQKVCGMLPDHRLASTGRDYPVQLDEPLCGVGYNPPMP